MYIQTIRNEQQNSQRKIWNSYIVRCLNRALIGGTRKNTTTQVRLRHKLFNQLMRGIALEVRKICERKREGNQKGNKNFHKHVCNCFLRTNSK